MKIDIEKMNEFMEEFENKFFPTIKGTDGKGIERLRSYVEKQREKSEEIKVKLNMKNNIFNVGDTVRHKYTNETRIISDFGTGNGKVSIGCVNATKSEWELISNN